MLRIVVAALAGLLGCAGWGWAQAPALVNPLAPALPLVQADAAPPKIDLNGKNGNGDKDEKNGNGDKEKDKEPKADKPARTLFEWAIGPKEEEKEDGEEGAEDEDEDDTIVTDRPDFTEASSTVPRGAIQLESGYTFFSDRSNGTNYRAHSYPEALFRIGLTEWFELRIAQNFASERSSGPDGIESDSGAVDLYLGCKIGLTQQKKYLPEMAIIFQTTLPTGAEAFNAEEVNPGINLLYSWDVIPDFLSIGGSTQGNRSSNEFVLPEVAPGAPALLARDSHIVFAQSITIGYSLTDKLSAYTESFAFFPTGANDPEVKPEYYFDGGFTYLLTKNFQLDIRAGVGLNEHADDYFVGSGFAVRY